jgi:hypothetical protein
MKILSFFLLVLLLFSSTIGMGKTIILLDNGRLPDKADKSSNYIAAKNAIALTESGGNVCAKNPWTSASGKYQFMRAWNGFFIRNYGRSWASVVPKCKAGRDVKIRMEKHQDAMFDIYYNMHAGPFIASARKKTKGWSDIQLLALYHRQGEAGAWRYLRTGHDFANGKWGNTHVKVHIKRVLQNVKYQLIANEN